MKPRPASDATPLDAPEFATRLDRLGPFESNPVIAVAVSGGADSLALLRLADHWARARGGRVVALTVDHSLRAESAAEAAQIGAVAASRNIEHHVLDWTGAKPTSGIQAAARTARYGLLGEWCRSAAILHLLLGHHRGDQAETLIMRLSRGSGTDGVAGMAAIVETADLRLLRPLLDVPRERLVATLRALGQTWIEDPSNRDRAFARVRARQRLDGFEASSLGAAARDHGGERASRDSVTAALLARAAAIYPEGWARLDPNLLRGRPALEVRRALSRLVMAIGGGTYPPRGERLDRLVATLLGDGLAAGRTLGGCRLVQRRDALLVVREDGKADEAIRLAPRAAPTSLRWDNRFRLELIARVEGLRIARLGADGWAAIAGENPRLRAAPIPALARLSLPAIWDLDGVVAVPHLFYGRGAADPGSVKIVSVSFEPRQPVAGPQFPVC